MKQPQPKSSTSDKKRAEGRPAAARRAAPQDARDPDSAGVLLQKLGQALKRPGLPRDAVFGNSQTSVAYSVYPKDPSKLLRISADGTRTIGRLVRGRFKALPDQQ